MTLATPHPVSPAPGVIYWFRHDLRLHDAPALTQAAALARRLGGWLLPVYVHDPALRAPTPWGFERTGPQRRAWLGMALQDLSAQLQGLGSRLLHTEDDPVRALSTLAQALGQPLLVCEEIAAPEEEGQVQALRQRGLTVHTIWQSTLMAPESLPFAPEAVPDVFTPFRQALESQGVRPCPPAPTLRTLPPLPQGAALQTALTLALRHPPAPPPALPDLDDRTAFPWHRPAFHGGEQAALAHLRQYCARGLPHHYKATRNAVDGVDNSSKWSPWLATGALSARTAWAAIAAFEAEHGASPSTYWLGFELLWRDHFRWLHRKHGRRLYRARGLNGQTPPPHDPAAFARWCRGETGQRFIDAGMRELAATGYMSNRMRQNVASYLIHDLGGDWRAGAAWFESCLIDHDVYSNQGNWLYLSGRGTDPRPQRRFNPELQARTHDPEGRYRRAWGF